MTELNADKQQLLDLLVDGELGDDERRELLAWCEREADGWRRCALVFLEAQDWSQVLGDLTERVPEAAVLASEAAVKQAAPRLAASPLVRPQTFWNVRQWGTMLAMAASVALAFTLGVWVRDAGKEPPIAPNDRSSVQFVENKSPGRIQRGHPEQGPAEAVLGAGGLAGAAEEIRVPVRSLDDVDDGWLLAEPSAVPDEVRQALERLGHRVEQRRQLVPYRLDDGRRVVVPVDQVEVRPVENRSYQ
jgi:hypothetical protein